MFQYKYYNLFQRVHHDKNIYYKQYKKLLAYYYLVHGL